jgi:hypothetical protein
MGIANLLLKCITKQFECWRIKPFPIGKTDK